VTLTVYDYAGGSSTTTVANYIVASPAPTISSILSAGNLVLSGANCPAAAPYRILCSRDLVNWFPVTTNVFLSDGSFSCFVGATNAASFFELVSP